MTPVQKPTNTPELVVDLLDKQAIRTVVRDFRKTVEAKRKELAHLEDVYVVLLKWSASCSDDGYSKRASELDVSAAEAGWTGAPEELP